MLAGKIAPADTSPELAAASGLCPNNSISSAKTSRTTQVWRTGLTGLPCRRSRHNLCFHFAFGFCGTLRLAHMLYSLARVSRRDRWCRTFHHPGRTHGGGTPASITWYRSLAHKPPGLNHTSTHEEGTCATPLTRSSRRWRIIPVNTTTEVVSPVHRNQGGHAF